MMSLKENLRNKTYQTKPNLPNQTEETRTYQMKFTKPNLAELNIELLIELKHEAKVLNRWVLCAFGNVFSINCLLLNFNLGFFHPCFSNIDYFAFSILSLLVLSFSHVERKEFKEMYFVRTSLQPNHQIIN